MHSQIATFIKHDDGADLIEYALLAGLLSLACFAVLQGVGTNLNSLFTTLSNKLALVLP